jgi:hypothetical protein
MTVILGPTVTGSPTVRVKDKASGRVLHKKQILPEGEYDYKGTKLDLNADVLKGYVKSFQERAFDEVPFQLGGSESEHNNDPLRRAGTLVHMEHIPGKGLNGYFDFSADPQMAAYVEKYPRFGVSARIEPAQKRADGKTFGPAIQHVLGTLVPRINDMASWEKVELSQVANTEDEVVDLSTELIDLDAPPVIDFINDRPIKEGEGVPLSAEEEAAFRQYQADQILIDSLVNDPTLLSGVQTVVNPPAPPVTQTGPLVDTEARAQVRALQVDLARSRWETQAQALAAAGVPPAAIELAAPIMEEPEDRAIELSSGARTTDKARTLALLEAMKGTIDLGPEQGHQASLFGTPEDQNGDLDKWAEFLDLNA